jgi:hypothetical protein
MRPNLVVGGKLTVPLFHGTSTLFQSSILETGLGGRNVIEDLGLRAIVHELLTYDEDLATIPNWTFERQFLLKVAEDPSCQNPVGHTGFNFRYGGTYVTPSKQTAARYALSSDCGSEALACLKALDAVWPSFRT